MFGAPNCFYFRYGSEYFFAALSKAANMLYCVDLNRKRCVVFSYLRVNADIIYALHDNRGNSCHNGFI